MFASRLMNEQGHFIPHDEVPSKPRAAPCQHSRYCGYRQEAAKWAFLTAGVGSLMWFLVRVIPKPSRAAYPCQRATAPFAGAFVVWLLAMLGAKWALRRRREFARQRRFAVACACTAAALVCWALALRSLPESDHARKDGQYKSDRQFTTDAPGPFTGAPLTLTASFKTMFRSPLPRPVI
jgi:hypothetical protein